VTLAGIAALFAARGHETYGEGVSQAEHAVQCATLARDAGEPPAMIAAALLHDLGHLIAGHGGSDGGGAHEAVGARALARCFGASVWRPVALHVAAKRWLCAVDLAYAAALSAESQRSLVRQGGAFDATAAAAFARLPDAAAAIRLRRYDDAGKADGPPAAAFADFLPMLQALTLR